MADSGTDAQSGQIYNAEDGRKALRDVFALGLFDNVQIFPKQNTKNEAQVLACDSLSNLARHLHYCVPPAATEASMLRT
jgi:outer membrane protein assembly factor BamA